MELQLDHWAPTTELDQIVAMLDGIDNLHPFCQYEGQDVRVYLGIYEVYESSGLTSSLEWILEAECLGYVVGGCYDWKC